jgi:hypothetical protein
MARKTRYYLSGYRHGKFVGQTYRNLRDLKAAYHNNQLDAAELVGYNMDEGKVRQVLPLAGKVKQVFPKSK